MASWEDWINRQIGGIEAHPWQSALEAAGIGAAVAFPFVAPEIAAGFGAADLGVGAAEAGAVGADVGLGAAGAEAGLTGADVAAASELPSLAGAGADFAGAAGAAAPVVDTAAGLSGADVAAASELPGLGADALNFANLGTTVGADTAGELAQAPSLTGTLEAGQTALGAPSAGANAVASVGQGGTIAPSAIAGGNDPNIAAAIDAELPSVSQTPTTTAQFAASANPVTPSGEPDFAAMARGPGSDAMASASTDAAAPAAAPAAPSTASSVSSALGSALNSPYTKAAELALPLGFLGYNLLKGPPAIPPQTQQAVTQAQAGLGVGAQAQQNVPALQQTTAQNLAQANANQVNPGQQADLDTQAQNEKNQLYQQLANQGINPQSSTQWIQGQQQIDQKIAAQKAQMVQGLYTTAFAAQTSSNAALGVVSNANAQLISALQNAGAQQVASNTAFTNATASAMQSFGMMAALSGGFGSGRTQTTQVQNPATG